MSLESQIGSLVEAANNLTGTVAGKVQEIDQKVDEATTAVEEKIRRDMDSRLFVDAINGSDNNSGLRLSEPKKTITGAVLSSPPNSSVRISLRTVGVHLIEDRIELNGRKLLIDGYDTSTGEVDTYPEIRQVVRAGSTVVTAGGFVVGKYGMVKFHRCIIKTAYLDDPAFDDIEWGDWRISLVSSMTSIGVVWAQSCIIDIAHLPFSHQHSTGSTGFLDHIYGSTTINKVDLSSSVTTTSRQLLIGSFGQGDTPFRFYVVSNVDHNFESWGEMISTGVESVVSNVGLTDEESE